MAFLRALPVAAVFAVALYFLLSSFSSPYAAKPSPGYTGKAEIPTLGLGTWLSEYDKVAHATEFALTTGYDHIDSALIYRNEDQTGKGTVASGRPRSSFWVTSKLWNSDHRPAEAEKAIQKTISDLQVGYLDLYLIHWPVAFVPGEGSKLDKKTSILDTWRTLESFVEKGYTRYIGISNFDKAQVEELLKDAKIKPYAHQFETHPYLQQQGFVDFHKEVGIKVVAYSPLANLNPFYDKGLESILKDPFWKEIAQKKNATVPQVVLAWGLQRGTIVIPRTVKESHISENLEALNIKFTEEELKKVGEEDKKVRMSNPSKSWGIQLFGDLDDHEVSDDAFDEL